MSGGIERRREPRRPVNGDFPGKLIITSLNKEISCKPYDVSRSGLSVVTDYEILPEFELAFKTEHHYVELELVWGLANYSGNPSLFRYGFRVVKDNEDLDSIFSSLGY